MKDSVTESAIQLKFEADLNEEFELISATMPSIQTQIPGMKIARIYVLIINISRIQTEQHAIEFVFKL